MPDGNLVQSGSAGLRLILEEVTEPGDGVLVPEYLCAAVESTVVHAGRSVGHYPVSDRLEPCVPELVAQLDRAVRAVVVPRYLGVTSRGLVSISQECRRRRVALIEDLVGVADLLGFDGVDIVGDFAFNSLRKFIPVPDGAQVFGVAAQNFGLDGAAGSDVTQDRLRAMTELGEARSRHPGSPQELSALAALHDSESRLAAELLPRGASPFTASAAATFDSTHVVGRRRENYAFLRDRFGSHGLAGGRVLPLWPDRDVPHSPLAFPVLVPSGRDALRAQLAAERVFCPIHWPVESSRWALMSSAARALAQAVLSIPIDQRLTLEDVEWISDRIDRIG